MLISVQKATLNSLSLCVVKLPHVKTSKVNTFTVKSIVGFLLVQFFLFDLQLQHNGVELHVQIVGSLKFPLVVLSDVQCMSARRGKWGAHYSIFLLLLQLSRFLNSQFILKSFIVVELFSTVYKEYLYIYFLVPLSCLYFKAFMLFVFPCRDLFANLSSSLRRLISSSSSL